MILSEYDRRWAEIRLYRYCLGIFSLRNRSIDIIDSIDHVCALGDMDATRIRPIVQNMMHDTYYQTSKREMILIGHAKGLQPTVLGKFVGMTRQGVDQYIKRNQELFTPIPRCNLEDDYSIIEFLKILDRITEVENLGYGTIN